MKNKLFCLALILAMLLSLPLATAAEEGSAAETSGSKLIAITFDDGPGPYTAQLLDALKARNAHATFFCVGNRVASYSKLVAREYNEGHQVAAHSWDHPQLTSLSAAGVQSQISRTNAALKNVTGQSGFYLRPPYGSYNSTVKNCAGAPLILWSVDTLDWKYRNATTVKNNILNNAKDGAIVLLHDIHGTSVAGAIAAMDVLIDRGYELVTVAELFARRGVTPKSGGVYTSVPANGVDIKPTPADGADYDETKLDKHWAYNAICYVREHGLMSGLDETRFGPEKYMTRGMFVTVLSRMAQADTSAVQISLPFTDVAANRYYYGPIGWAYEHNIVSGMTTESFAPESFITREQLCTLIKRYADFAGITLASLRGDVIFSDAKAISVWAQDSIDALQRAAIVGGMGDGSFNPQGKATRAQAAAIFERFCTAYIDVEQPPADTADGAEPDAPDQSTV